MSSNRQDRIAETLDACARYWLTRNRIPAAEVLEMREELELHLWEADRDGKPPKRDELRRGEMKVSEARAPMQVPAPPSASSLFR